MDTTENTPVVEATEPKTKLSRKAIVIGSATAGALGLLLLTALTKKKPAETVVEDTDSTEG